MIGIAPFGTWGAVVVLIVVAVVSGLTAREIRRASEGSAKLAEPPLEDQAPEP